MRAVSFLLFLLFVSSVIGAQGVADGLTRPPSGSPESNWQAFQNTHKGVWRAVWNPATGTPKAIFGPGLAVASSVRSLAQARALSAAVLARHARLLGRGESEFVLRTSVKARQLYILVYRQAYRGLDVISGRADVRLHERGVVSMFGASAVPIPRGFDIRPKLSAVAARVFAEREVLGQVRLAENRREPRLVVWADTEGTARVEPTLAYEVRIDDRPDATIVGTAFVDAASGRLLRFQNGVFHSGASRVARGRVESSRARPRHLARTRGAEPEVRGSSARPRAALQGVVMGWVNLSRTPNGALTNVPLANLEVTSAAGNTFTDAHGSFSIPYPGSSAVTVTASLGGRHSGIVKVAQGTPLRASVSVTPGTDALIQIGSATMGVRDRAQTTTYWHVDDVHEWVRGMLVGATKELDVLSGIEPEVNIAKHCNAYYTANTINFYDAGGACNSSAYQTVIQHEWAHGLDDVFGGISLTDGLSEGWSDTIAIYRSGQPIVAPQFYRSGAFIRSAHNYRRYPAGGPTHQQGETWMGFAWDLRENLILRHGEVVGARLATRIVIPSIAADARNQPDAVREVFLLDDDDGNLNNGTPNYPDLELAALGRTLPYPVRINPNAGKYSLYGTGCEGSGKVAKGCASGNPGTSAVSSLTQNSNVFAMPIPAASGQMTIAGFELFSQTTVAATMTIQTQIFWADASGRPHGSPVRLGTMQLSFMPGWYATRFVTPLIVPAGRRVAISYTPVPTQMMFPVSASGVPTPHFWHPPAAAGWNGPFSQQPWAFKLICATRGGAVPALQNVGFPELGQRFWIQLSEARPLASGLLLLGFSDKKWGTIPLPLQLASWGAPGCNLLSSGEWQIGLKTDATGAHDESITVPNTAHLFGLEFFNQFVITDPKNPFGLVFSNAGKGTIGKQ